MPGLIKTRHIVFEVVKDLASFILMAIILMTFIGGILYALDRTAEQAEQKSLSSRIYSEN